MSAGPEIVPGVFSIVLIVIALAFPDKQALLALTDNDPELNVSGKYNVKDVPVVVTGDPP